MEPEKSHEDIVKNITVNGDYVERKYVEYEVGNVEEGGIGIQNNYYSTHQPKAAKPKAKGGIKLPKDLDTPRAREAFAKAMEKQYLEPLDDGKYRWIGTDDNGTKAELAYFLGRVYNYKHTFNGNAGENFPEESLNELFGEKRLYTSLTQVYNAQKPQRWRSLIDALFE